MVKMDMLMRSSFEGVPHSGVSICKTAIPESITLGHHGVTHLNALTVFLFSNFGHLPFFLKSLFSP